MIWSGRRGWSDPGFFDKNTSLQPVHGRKKPGFFSWIARVVRNRVFYKNTWLQSAQGRKKPGFEDSECVQDFSSCFLLPSSCFLLPYSIKSNLQINRVS